MFKSKWGYLHQIPPIRPHGTPRKSIRTRGNGDEQENKAFQIYWENIIWTHRDWHSHQMVTMSLEYVLCEYIIASSLGFRWDSWVHEWVRLWFYCLLLGYFSYCWFVLPKFYVLVLFYLIILYLFIHSFILCLPIGIHPFSVSHFKKIGFYR